MQKRKKITKQDPAWCTDYQLWADFTHCPCAFIDDFEHDCVNLVCSYIIRVTPFMHKLKNV